MFVIRVRLTIKPESQIPLTAYMQAEAQRNSKLDGCEAYTLYQDPTDPQAFLLYEEWRDAHAFDAYRTSDTFKQLMTVLQPMMESRPNSAYYDSVRVGP